MLLNEIINEVGMTKRAVKYYEEKGLLSVDKDNNGYRNYTAQDVETLKKISVYRKLGISIKDIQSLLETGDKSILLRIYQEKVQEKVLKEKSFSQRAFSIYTGIRKLQDKAKTSYTLSIRRPRFGYEQQFSRSTPGACFGVVGKEFTAYA